MQERMCIENSCVTVISAATRGCLGIDPFRVSLAASCLLGEVSPGYREALRNLLNDIYVICNLMYDMVLQVGDGIALLLPRGCSVAAVDREKGCVRVETSCGLGGVCCVEPRSG